MSFFRAKKAELMHCDFAVLLSRTDAFGSSRNILKQLNGSLTLSTKSFSELFRFAQTSILAGEAPRAEELRTLQNPIVNDGDATVDKCNIDKGNAW